MNDVIETVRSITWSTSVDETWDILTEKMDGYGFDRLLYAATRLSGRSMGSARDAMILSNYPDDYVESYVEGEMFRDAPLVRWAIRNTGARSWREVKAQARAGELSSEEVKVIEFNDAHGVRAGYIIAFPRSSPRSGFGIGLGTTRMTQDEVDALWAERGPEIEVIAGTAHLKLISLPHGRQIERLTARQREVLELVADGKTISDVAEILGRTSATVEKHLRLARDALEVETTAQAILKVSIQNQFFTFANDGTKV